MRGDIEPRLEAIPWASSTCIRRESTPLIFSLPFSATKDRFTTQLHSSRAAIRRRLFLRRSGFVKKAALEGATWFSWLLVVLDLDLHSQRLGELEAERFPNFPIVSQPSSCVFPASSLASSIAHG
jgi:hypothetical protein